MCILVGWQPRPPSATQGPLAHLPGVTSQALLDLDEALRLPGFSTLRLTSLLVLVPEPPSLMWLPRYGVGRSMLHKEGTQGLPA